MGVVAQMSGPKCDGITLSPAAMEWIQQQRRQKLQVHRHELLRVLEQDAVNQSLRDVLTLRQAVANYPIESIKATLDDPILQKALLDIADQRPDWIAEIDRLASIPMPADYQALVGYSRRLKTCLHSIRTAFDEARSGIDAHRLTLAAEMLNDTLVDALKTVSALYKLEIAGNYMDLPPAVDRIEQLARIFACHLPSGSEDLLQKMDSVRGEAVTLSDELKAYTVGGEQAINTVDSSRSRAALVATKEKWQAYLDEMCTQSLPLEPAAMLAQAGRLMHEMAQVRENARREVLAATERLKNFTASAEVLERHEQHIQRIAVSPQRCEPLAELVFGGGMSGDSEALSEEMRLLQDKLDQYLTDTIVSTEDKSELQAIMREKDLILRDETRTSHERRRALNRVKGMFAFLRQRIESRKEAFAEKYTEYLVECSAAGISGKQASGFTSLDELTLEVEGLRAQAMHKMTQDYVRQQVDEVMREHGYNVIHSEVLTPLPLPDGTRQLYEFDAGSAISVYQSQQGTVMMEVVATGQTTDMTHNERLVMVEKQRQFCSVYAAIRSALSRRGVVLSALDHKAPDISFSRKIKLRTHTDSSQSRAPLKVEDRKRVMYIE
jgi:hypothetical protein